jgi:hypothetical protein
MFPSCSPGDVQVEAAAAAQTVMARDMVRRLKVDLQLHADRLASTNPEVCQGPSLNVPSMFPQCSLNVPAMFLQCSLNIPSMFPERSLNVPRIFSECSLNVPSMFSECSLNVPSMFSLNVP